MSHAARIMESAEPVLRYARVRTTRDDVCILDTDHGPVRASRAAGCLLAPRPGDLVLACLDPDGTTFVLSVLRRAEGAPGEIAYAGALTVRAADDLSLCAAGDVALAASNQLTVAASQGEITFTGVRLVAKTATVTLGALTLLAGAVEHIVSRLTQRLTNAVRLVAEHDESQAGSARHLVEDTLTIHAKNAVHVAEEVVKIDAGQVHLG